MMTKSLYEVQEKFNLYMELNKNDRNKFGPLIKWSGKALDLSIKERNVRSFVAPLKRQIWTVEFGENVGTEISGIRPCLIVQENNNDNSATVVAIPITSHNPRYDSHITLERNHYESVNTDAEKAIGSVMTEQIRVLSKGRLGRLIGTINEDAMKDIDHCILATLGVNSN